MKKCVLSFLVLLISLFSFASGHFVVVVPKIVIGQMNLIILDASINGIALEEGDEIASFDGHICCGKLIISQPNTTNEIVCFQKEDVQSNGFTVGHTITFKFWDNSGNIEIADISADYLDNPSGQPVKAPLYAAKATAFVKLSGHLKIVQNIVINPGWNLFSANVIPDSLDLKTIFMPFITKSKLKKVMDATGRALENFVAFGSWNNIGDFIPDKGYTVQVKHNCALNIPSIANKSADIVPEVLASLHFEKVYKGNGADHFNSHLVNLAFFGSKVGDDIGDFDGKSFVGSAKVGQVQILSGPISIPISCNNNPFGAISNFTPGNKCDLQLFSESQTYPLIIEKVNGNESFEKNRSLFAKVSASNLYVKQIEEDQVKCYPYPFIDQ